MATSYPNQFTVTTEKSKCNRESPYFLTNLDAFKYAIVDLEGKALKLWLYLNSNNDGYKFALSKVDAVKNYGMGSSSTYQRAKKELIEKGYLVETSPNHYTFYDKPKKIPMDEFVIKKDCD